MKKNRLNEKIRYSDIWDFSIFLNGKDYIFEIWWKNKTKKQIKWILDSYVVKDDIIDMWDKIIPLWLFWFMY